MLLRSPVALGWQGLLSAKVYKDELVSQRLTPKASNNPIAHDAMRLKRFPPSPLSTVPIVKRFDSVLGSCSIDEIPAATVLKVYSLCRM